MADFLVLNNKKFYYEEISNYSFRNSIAIDGYEAKTLEFCRNWLNGVQEFPMHTSGSTGTPKLITLTRRQLEASARKTISFLGLQAGDRTLVCLNTEFIAGAMMLIRGFMADLLLTIVTPVSNPFTVLPPQARDFEFGSFVPLQLHTIFSESQEFVYNLSQMEAILVGGGPVSPALEHALQQLKAPVYQTYGMTETVSHIALRQLNGVKKPADYQVLPNITINQDERGCLTIKGDITENEELVTNDLVELTGKNTFNWLGRADNTIISGGVKVQVEKTENALESAMQQLNIHRRCFVSSLPDEKFGQAVIAIIEGTPLSASDEANLKSLMKRDLTKYEQPRNVYYINAFDQTPTGKIDRNRTREKL